MLYIIFFSVFLINAQINKSQFPRKWYFGLSKEARGAKIGNRRSLQTIFVPITIFLFRLAEGLRGGDLKPVSRDANRPTNGEILRVDGTRTKTPANYSLWIREPAESRGIMRKFTV